MKTTTETTVTGIETIDKDKVWVKYEIVSVRDNNGSTIRLYVTVGKERTKIGFTWSHDGLLSYEENYELALEEAQEKWGIKLKKESV